MIQSATSQAASALLGGTTRDAGRESTGDQSANFELAIAALFQAPASETSRASDTRLGGVAVEDQARQRTPAKGSKDKGAKARDAAEPQPPSTLGADPRLIGQQTAVEAQQRLNRSADVADRAAAELRGDADHADDASSSEQSELASPESRGKNDAPARPSSSDRPSPQASSVAAREGPVASQDSGAKPGSAADRAGASTAQAVTSTQQNSGGSQQGGAGSRQQSNTATPVAGVNNAAASAAQTKQAAAGNAISAAAPSTPNLGATTSAGPGSLAGVRDPLRAFTARPEPKAAKAPVDQSALPNQVARGLAAAVRQRDGTLTLRLSPDSLGDIKIQVRVESGRVSAHIDAQTDQARQLLTESAATLRSALEAHGLVVERIEVAPAERHATMDPAMAHAPIVDERAQGGALSAPDQPPPQGFGDGAPPEHRDTSGHNADHASQRTPFDASIGAPGEATAGAVDASAVLDQGWSSEQWVLRVDLVA